MNTLLPKFEKFRVICLLKLETRGWLRRRRARAHEIQLEFRWR